MSFKETYKEKVSITGNFTDELLEEEGVLCREVFREQKVQCGRWRLSLQGP